MVGGEVFPTEESILWMHNLIRTVERFSIAVKKWQESVLLMKQPAFASFLQSVWGFYSASTAQPSCRTFSFSGITWVRIRASPCTRKSVLVVCRTVAQLGYFSILSSCTVQTRSSCDRVSISRSNYVERMKKQKTCVFFSGVYEILKLYKLL